MTIKILADKNGDFYPKTTIEAVENLQNTINEKADKTALDSKAEKTALEDEIDTRTSADSQLQAKIDEKANQSALEEEAAVRAAKDTELEEKIAEKEDKSNKVVAFGEVPSDEKYPSEKLVKEKCFDIDYQITETNDYKFAEHRMGNGIVVIEGFIKTFSLGGTSGKTFYLSFKNNLNMIKIAPISRSASGYADISYAMTELASENRIKFEMYNSGSGNVDVGPSFIGFGRVV